MLAFLFLDVPVNGCGTVFLGENNWLSMKTWS